MFRLAHLSDPAYRPLPAPTWRELLNKRLTGYLNWQRGRAHHHRMDVLDRLIADIVQADVDHVAVTGDLVNLGLPDEYKAARTLLWRIGPPDRVSFVPGNHDAYMRQTVPQIVLQWRPWFLSDGVDESERRLCLPLHPRARRRGADRRQQRRADGPLPRHRLSRTTADRGARR